MKEELKTWFITAFVVSPFAVSLGALMATFITFVLTGQSLMTDVQIAAAVVGTLFWGAIVVKPIGDQLIANDR